MASYIIVAIIAYLIGSISFSVLISKKMAGFDLREKGSGNAGTTNVLRTVGISAAVLTLICDILKGIVAVVFALIVGNIVNGLDRALLIQIAGICVVLGHTFPVFFGFKGGKGIATTLGILLIVNWQIALICAVFAIIIIAITKMVSVGSLGAAILFPILTLFITQNFIVAETNFKYFIFSILIALLVMFNHRENLKRIMLGNENKLSFKNVNK